MGRVMVVIACAALVACGARTGLDAGPAPEPDAALPFDTFPCSWSWGLPYEVARGGVYGQLTGAIGGSREEALLLSTEDGVRRATRLSLTNPPSLLARSTLGADEAAGLPLGWVTRSGCRLTLRDAELGELRALDIAPSRECSFESVDPRFVDLDMLGSRGLSAVRYDEGGELLPGCTGATLPTRAVTTGHVVRLPGDGCAFAWRSDGALSLRDDAGADIMLRFASAFALTDDTLRPAALIVWRDDGDWLRFARLPRSASRLDELGATRLPHAEPLQVVTNETEALVPLADGRLAIQPLSGSALRILPPPEARGRVEALRVIMRAGASVGGALYVIRSAGQSALHFAPLSCNR